MRSCAIENFNVIVTVKAQEELVVCRASTNCSGVPGDDLGVMTIEECCMNDTVNGLGFTEGEICSPCIGERLTLRHLLICIYDGILVYQ